MRTCRYLASKQKSDSQCLSLKISQIGPTSLRLFFIHPTSCSYYKYCPYFKNFVGFNRLQFFHVTFLIFYYIRYLYITSVKDISVTKIKSDVGECNVIFERVVLVFSLVAYLVVYIR